MKDIDRETGVVRFDGLDEAIVGLASQYTKTPVVLCYDREKILEILMRDGMTAEDAEEYFEFNIGCLWAGDSTPIILERASPEEIAEFLEFDKPSE